MIAIYAIHCKSTGKHYVGSSTRLETRFKALRSVLNLGNHGCTDLQADWVRFGESDFEFLTLEAVEDLEDVPEREKHYLATLDCYKTHKVPTPNAYAGKSYVSERMLHAMDLIRSGATAYAASKETGVSASTISRSKLYRDWLEQKAKEREKAKQAAQTAAPKRRFE